MIDYAKSTVEEIILFEAEPDDNMRQMADVLYEASKDVAYGVRHMKANPGACVEHIIRAKKAENKVERLYRNGLAALFPDERCHKDFKKQGGLQALIQCGR